MFIIKGPYPSPQVTVLMPSPQWGDSVAPTGTLNTMRMMDGTRRTYVVSRNGRKRRQWDFILSRAKAQELQAFFKAYYRTKVLVVDHDGTNIVGYIVNNPFEFSGSGRAYGWPGGESMDVTIELEEAS